MDDLGLPLFSETSISWWNWMVQRSNSQNLNLVSVTSRFQALVWTSKWVVQLQRASSARRNHRRGGWCPDPSTKGGHSVATFNPETLGWIVGWDPKNNPLWVRIWFNSQTRCIVSRDFVGWSEGQKSLEHREHFARFLQRVLTSPNVLNAFQFSRKAELADWISEDTFCRILFILARSSEITTMFQVPFQRLEWDLFTPGTWASLSGNRAFI